MSEVHEFPVVKENLTLDEAIALVKRRLPTCGILIYENQDGEICHTHFGTVTRRDALWFAECLKDEALHGNEDEDD